MTLSERQCDFTEAVAKLVLFIRTLGYKAKVQEWNRLVETQKEYVAKGVSKTMDSRHLDNLAADLYIFKDGVRVDDDDYLWLVVGRQWEALGGRWGGRFGREHLEEPARSEKLGWDRWHVEFRKA